MSSSYDQHFLEDKETISLLVEAANLKKDDIVLEVGSGRGNITSLLAMKCRKVIAVEIDKGMSKYLENMPNNVDVVYDNILNVIERLNFNKIVANIPYSISEPFLKKLLKIDIDLAVLLIGEKFYHLLTGKESKWSIIIQSFYEINKIKTVPKEKFNPPPKAESIIISFNKKKNLTKKEILIREIILQSDKKLKNALMYSFKRVFDASKRDARSMIDSMETEQKVLEKRVAILSNKEFKQLLNRIDNFK